MSKKVKGTPQKSKKVEVEAQVPEQQQPVPETISDEVQVPEQAEVAQAVSETIPAELQAPEQEQSVAEGIPTEAQMPEQVEVAQPDEPEKAVTTAEVQLDTSQPPSLLNLQRNIEVLWRTIQEHSRQIQELQESLIRKRKLTFNGKKQIRDRQTGKVYRSQNNTYQSMLKAGELKELVDKGIFGSDPAKNNFGWFALVREWPNRFEEIKPEESQQESTE